MKLGELYAHKKLAETWAIPFEAVGVILTMHRCLMICTSKGSTRRAWIRLVIDETCWKEVSE